MRESRSCWLIRGLEIRSWEWRSTSWFLVLPRGDEEEEIEEFVATWLTRELLEFQLPEVTVEFVDVRGFNLFLVMSAQKVLNILLWSETNYFADKTYLNLIFQTHWPLHHRYLQDHFLQCQPSLGWLSARQGFDGVSPPPSPWWRGCWSSWWGLDTSQSFGARIGQVLLVSPPLARG